MVLLYPMLKKYLQEEARQKGHEEGRQEGRQETHDAWEAWLKRRDEAHANNQPFDEPRPSQKKNHG